MRLAWARLRRVLLVAFPAACCAAEAASAASATNMVRILVIQGTPAQIRTAGSSTWVLTTTNQTLSAGDYLRTAKDSRVILQWSDRSVLHIDALSEIKVLPPDKPGSLLGMLMKGAISFFHREKPERIQVLSRGASAGVKGTEFVMEASDVDGDERVQLWVIDGLVELTNRQGALSLSNGEQGVIEPGQAPARRVGFIANNVLQWCFYYPGVLNLEDISLSTEETQTLKDSLEAYRAGDLLDALAKYPAERVPASDAERVYHAALLLSVGQVEQTENELGALAGRGEIERLANALRTLIAAVKRSPNPSTNPPLLSTELLAASYYEQSRATGDESLESALDLARRAARLSPQFGFAWERVAELAFSFGHTREAEAALDKSLDLSPRNAQGLALKGFLAAARNKPAEAIQWFDRAIAVDGALGNAWLGRGLCKIRLDMRFFDSGFRISQSALDDLLVAAALEPQRSLLRSYLGKAFADHGEDGLARAELERAMQLDPNDPTAWLYGALLKQRANRINEAVSDLERSNERNDNRSLFRSQMLLDQDRAVRSANLAGIYRDAGMDEVSLREAVRAVTYDYANDSAHLFISDSFNELRDPTRFNLRYETVWFNELLLANLLAPVGAGRLAQHVTQQEYSSLFDSDSLGLANETTYRSDGQIRELASQFGTFKNTSWALDFDYQHNEGIRPNNELERFEWYTTVKQQLTPRDSVLLLAKYQDYSSGDNFQYYDPANARPNFTFEEHQEPILIGGFQHQWSPGIRTLLLGGRLVNEQRFSDLQVPQALFVEGMSGALSNVFSHAYDVTVENDLEIYTFEATQLVQQERFAIIAGALRQGGRFDFNNSFSNSTIPVLLPPFSASFSEPYDRVKLYGYLTIEPIDKLWLTGGVAYDDVRMPSNFRNPPQSSGVDNRDFVGPRAAIVWSPLTWLTVRGIYSHWLGGVSLDESYRLEPTQLAGFPQAFRSVISESLVGSVSAPEYEVLGLALDLKPTPATYAGVQLERIKSSVKRTVGVLRWDNGLATNMPSSTTQEHLEFEEESLSITVNQLLGDSFVVGGSYRLTRAELETVFPEVQAAALPDNDGRNDESAYLHQLRGHLLYNHPCGFFARFDVGYYQQSNQGYSPDQPGDSFTQLDLQAGYRFLQRRMQVSVGLLNITDQDYRLNPLTNYAELPRERVFLAQLSFRF